MKNKKATEKLEHESGPNGCTSECRACEKENPARNQAKAQLESITELVKALERWQNVEAQDTREGQMALEEAEQQIHEDALSVEVRSDWYTPGQLPDHRAPSEYRILLCTGGPACRIIGDLENDEPKTARIEYQDWGTPWTNYPLTCAEEITVLQYARCFYFGG